MSKPLDELRAQRALIQQHLDWLDARIAAADDAPTAESPGEPDEVPSVSTAAMPRTTETAKKAPNTPAEVTKQTGESDATAPAPYFQIDQDAHSSSGSDIRKAQIGCFIIFIAAILGFLFLLFGLPYLVD